VLLPLRKLAFLLAAATAAATSSAGPDAVQVYGNFKRMSHTGDTTAKVRLGDIPAAPGTYAVGALAGLRGEVIMLDGRMLVTRGHETRGRTEAPAAADAATLLVISRVDAWHEVRIPGDMNQSQFEAFVLRQAAARGLLAGAAFAFLVRGEFPALTWHVVTSATAGAHGAAHGQGHASNRVFDEPGATGTLLGFHSGDALEGVISHPGERFHAHFANGDASRSGHADAYAVRAGGVLLLPAAPR
jgi:alpha-acetolactate decarboxylase